MKKYICPVCGYPDLDSEPFYGSHIICSCCGIQFGYEDTTLSHKELRKVWIKKGMPYWSTIRKKPENWDPIKQLKNLNLSDDEIEELKKQES